MEAELYSIAGEFSYQEDSEINFGFDNKNYRRIIKNNGNETCRFGGYFIHNETSGELVGYLNDAHGESRIFGSLDNYTDDHTVSFRKDYFKDGRFSYGARYRFKKTSTEKIWVGTFCWENNPSTLKNKRGIAKCQLFLLENETSLVLEKIEPELFSLLNGEWRG